MLFLSQAECCRCRSAISSDAIGVVIAALLLAALALLPGLCPLAFVQDVKRAVVGHASSEVRVDGVLDEPSWAAAPVIGEIVQREPRPGDAATEPTEVKLLYDENFLYIGVTCFDSEPDRIIGTRMARDSNLADDDRIENDILRHRCVAGPRDPEGRPKTDLARRGRYPSVAWRTPVVGTQGVLRKPSSRDCTVT